MLSINIENIKLNIKIHSFVSIIGKSGCGKTTLLRYISGLEKPKNGYIYFNDKIYFDDTNNVPIQKRDIGYVLQNFSLFPHMSILDNLLYAKKSNVKAYQLLDTFEISHLQNFIPNKLSQGEQQRVAIARALMLSPKLLLLDEIFSALDDEIKDKLFESLYKIHKELNLTTLFVTHNKNDTYKYSDEIIEYKHNKITQYKNNNDFISLQGKIHSIDDNITKIEIDGHIIEVPNEVLRRGSGS